MLVISPIEGLLYAGTLVAKLVQVHGAAGNFHVLRAKIVDLVPLAGLELGGIE